MRTAPAHRIVSLNSTLMELFSEAPARNNLRKGTFTASASEFLTLLPILLRYLLAVCLKRGECMPQVESMIAVLLVVELLLAVRTGAVDPDQLYTAILKHLNLFKAAYGTGPCRPKHHYVIHLSACLRRFRTLLHTLVQERKHRLVLRYGRDRDSLKNWELGALEEITCHQVWEMSENYRKSGLQGSHPPSEPCCHLCASSSPMLATQILGLHLRVRLATAPSMWVTLLCFTPIHVALAKYQCFYAWGAMRCACYQNGSELMADAPRTCSLATHSLMMRAL